MDQAHPSHHIVLARMSEVPVALCTRCGGAKTGRPGGLRKHCKLMRSNPAGRLELIGQGRHPYNKTRLVAMGPIRLHAQADGGPTGDDQVGEPGLEAGPGDGHAVEGPGGPAGREKPQEHEAQQVGYCSQDEEHELALLGLGLAGAGEEEEDPFGWGHGLV